MMEIFGFLKKSRKIKDMTEPQTPRLEEKPDPSPVKVLEPPPNVALKAPDYRPQGEARAEYVIFLLERFCVLKTDQIIRAVRARDFGMPEAKTDHGILNSLKTLSQRGYFHQVGRYKDGRVIYGIHKRQYARPHFDHDLKIAEIGIRLELAGVLESWLSDQAALKARYKAERLYMIPDAKLELRGSTFTHYVEFENSVPQHEDVREKLRNYRRQKESGESIRLLYVCAKPERVPRVRELAGDGMLVWIASYADVVTNPLECQWLTGDGGGRKLIS